MSLVHRNSKKMNIKMAHIREQGISFAVFAADATTRTNSGRSQLLASLVREAEGSGLKVDKAALCYQRGRNLEFYGTPDLVRFLSNRGRPRWTHELDI